MNLNRILSVSVQVPLTACRGQTDDMYCVCVYCETLLAALFGMSRWWQYTHTESFRWD